MEYVLLAMMSLILLKVYFPLTGVRVRNVAPPEQSPVIAGVSSHTHNLIKVWRREDVSHDSKGWWFQCSCGQISPGTRVGGNSYGSEANAIETFKVHVSLYKGLGLTQNNPAVTELNKVKKDYTEYRSKCYCKDANDDLILMKKEGKWD